MGLLPLHPSLATSMSAPQPMHLRPGAGWGGPLPVRPFIQDCGALSGGYRHDHSAYSSILADVAAREAFYESVRQFFPSRKFPLTNYHQKTPSLRPLSYKDAVKSWSKALVMMYTAKDRDSSDKAQREFKEYEINIVNVIGRVAYQRTLREYQRVIAKRLGNNAFQVGAELEVVSLFSSEDITSYGSSCVYVSPPRRLLALP